VKEAARAKIQALLQESQRQRAKAFNDAPRKTEEIFSVNKTWLTRDPIGESLILLLFFAQSFILAHLAIVL